jgi:hypothetical protein
MDKPHLTIRVRHAVGHPREGARASGGRRAQQPVGSAIPGGAARPIVPSPAGSRTGRTAAGLRTARRLTRAPPRDARCRPGRARRQDEGRASGARVRAVSSRATAFARQAREAECGRAQAGFLDLLGRQGGVGGKPPAPVARGRSPRPPRSGGRQRPQRAVDRDVLGSPRCRVRRV